MPTTNKNKPLQNVPVFTGTFLFYGLTILFLIFWVNPVKAQTSHFLDSIDLSLKQKTRFLIDYGTRNSFIANRRVQMSAVRIGVTFGDKFSAGGGYNELTGKVYRITTTNSPSIYMERLRIQYMAYFIEYTFYKSKHWEFTIPVQLGLGRSFYQPYDFSSYNPLEFKIFKPHFVAVYEPTMCCTYNFNRWVGAGVDVGYRILLAGRKSLAQKFNSPIYVVGIKLYYGTMYKDLKKYIREKRTA